MFFYLFIVCKRTTLETSFIEVHILDICYVLIVLEDEQQLLIAIKTFRPDGIVLNENLEVGPETLLTHYLVRQVGFERMLVLTFEDIQRRIEPQGAGEMQESSALQIPHAEVLFKIVDALFITRTTPDDSSFFRLVGAQFVGPIK
jgi:hypothetical protein